METIENSVPKLVPKPRSSKPEVIKEKPIIASKPVLPEKPAINETSNSDQFFNNKKEVLMREKPKIIERKRAKSEQKLSNSDLTQEFVNNFNDNNCEQSLNNSELSQELKIDKSVTQEPIDKSLRNESILKEKNKESVEKNVGVSQKSISGLSKLVTNRFRADSSDNMDSSGRYLLYDVREDEEQMIKMQEIIDLLVAGGYFRARIKGLNNFDKVVGGMSWAIEMSNVDLDIDILFQESLTIGQKIALTEKIVRVLQKMKCPHKIEPHQIQGMDCIHIFPVIQWLVKKSIETRQQMGDYIKSYANWQFNRCHNLEIDINKSKLLEKSSKSVSEIDVNRHPKRKYRHPARHKLPDEETKVKTTLLEYGRFATSRTTDESSNSGAHNSTNSGVRKDSDSRIMESLISSMHSETGKISAAFVGSIVGAQSDEIQQLAEEYQRKRVELNENSVERKEALLRMKVESTKKELADAKHKEKELIEKIDLVKERIELVRDRQKSFASNVNETQEEREEKLNLSHVLETLKKQKNEFKTFCREEKSRLEKQIEEMANQTDTEDENEVETEVKTYEEKHSKLKLQLADLNKNCSQMQRKFDDIPSRAELSQYQKRFIELYNQVAAKHNETKKFYTLYNTLDDERMYLEKELNLLNSILENFNQAQTSNSVREQFLLQFEQIVDSIKQTKLKVENRRLAEKMKKDSLNELYLELIEKQRLYYKAVKDFKEECKKNEILIAKVEEKAQNHKNN